MQDISPFDAIRQVDENGKEYWSARELGKLLEYGEYRFFKNAIKKAEEACKNSQEDVSYHFVQVHDMVGIGSGAKRKIDDVHMTRYACYLTVENSDPSKPIVALGQSYFAMKTREQEITEQLALSDLTEDQQRLVLRELMRTYNVRLAEAVHAKAGVKEPRQHARFQDQGYEGLYNGENENAIHTRKDLNSSEKILDWMGPEETGMNIFRATQADAALRRGGITTPEAANSMHYQVGLEVRKAVERLGGTMPELLPTPEKSIQQLQKEEAQRLKRGGQLSFLDE